MVTVQPADPAAAGAYANPAFDALSAWHERFGCRRRAASPWLHRIRSGALEESHRATASSRPMSCARRTVAETLQLRSEPVCDPRA